MSNQLPFLTALVARANLKPGACYAIDGDDLYIYYGQVAFTGGFGFFRYRSKEISVLDALAAPLMSRFSVIRPSVGTALRAGKWLYLGQHKLCPELLEEPIVVQWPVGTLEVTLWKGNSVIAKTKVHDPAIQDLEIIAAYDAIYHVPNRLHADFAQPKNAWSSGGSIHRERLKKQDLSTRFPEAPWHQLLPGWVPIRSGV